MQLELQVLEDSDAAGPHAVCQCAAEEGPCGGPAAQGDEGVNLRAPRGLRDRAQVRETDPARAAELCRLGVSTSDFLGYLSSDENLALLSFTCGLERRDDD
jgi:hypothetical protein